MFKLVRFLRFVGTPIFFFLNPSLLLIWMFEHDCLTHAVLDVLYACFIFLYLHLFSTIEHVSHGKALYKYNHYYHYYHESSEKTIYKHLQTSQHYFSQVQPQKYCIPIWIMVIGMNCVGLACCNSILDWLNKTLSTDIVDFLCTYDLVSRSKSVKVIYS